MGLILSVSIEGEKQLSQELLISASHIKDWRTPLSQSTTTLLKSFQMNFDVRGRMFGGWEPRKKSQPWPLLENTGRMRGGFRSTIGRDQAVIENNVPYFKYHQSNQSRSRLPRRVMMMIDEQRRNDVVKIFQRHIIESTRGLS